MLQEVKRAQLWREAAAEPVPAQDHGDHLPPKPGERRPERVAADVEHLEVALPAHVRQVPGQVVGREHERPQRRRGPEGLRHGALERVVPQAQHGQRRQRADPGGYLAAQHVVVEDQRLEADEARHSPRDRAKEVVPAHVDDLQRGEPTELARQGPPEAEPGQREHLEVGEPGQRRDDGPDGEVPGQRRRARCAGDVELRHSVPVAQDGRRARRTHGAAGAAAEVGAVAPVADHWRVVQELLDLDQSPYLRRLELRGLRDQCKKRREEDEQEMARRRHWRRFLDQENTVWSVVTASLCS